VPKKAGNACSGEVVETEEVKRVARSATFDWVLVENWEDGGG
jgi:hypothetical protein